MDRFLSTAGTALILLATLGTVVAQEEPQIKNPFKHIVLIFQENRTPDNLFQGLCVPPFGTSTSCSTAPSNKQYNISTKNWRNKTSPGGIMQPIAIPFGITYDNVHSHSAFVAMCDLNAQGVCQMDGAAGIQCGPPGQCPVNPQFGYVENSTGVMNPYLEMATQYGWGNYMFQTNQGSSMPAHQYMFSGTSAVSSSDDAAAIFVAENFSAPNGADYMPNSNTGCLAPVGEWNWLISPQSAPNETQLVNKPLGTYCWDHPTMASLIDQVPSLTWKYYATNALNPGGVNPGGTIWVAPNTIQQICQPDSNFQNCTGPEWLNNIDLNPTDVLKDVANCNLASMSWVTPAGQNSDHSGDKGNTGGPSWAAAIVNAIDNDATCEGGKGYWSDTAIIITWDDWGGWYDHVAPPILPGDQGDFQYGFRVPLIVVSAYTPQGYISNTHYDFGSILRGIEACFNLPGGMGALGFADARAKNDLQSFFQITKPPRKFQTIDAPLKADFFLQDTRPPEPPDND